MARGSSRTDGDTWRRVANAVPGTITWICILGAVVGVLVFPGQWLYAVAAFLMWVILRMAVMLVGAFIGEWRIRRWAHIDWSRSEERPSQVTGVVPADVRHVVLIPNYREPAEVLDRTLKSLAAQHRAAQRLIVVLAMEEREGGARAKAEEILAAREGAFLATLVTVHPGRLPGEVPGKSSNQAWAAARAREFVEELGIDIDVTTVTSCDADSVFHPNYFAALACLFADDEDRFRRFWQAPLRYYNNLRDVPFPLRLDLVFLHSAHLAELALPYSSLPISTYSLSFRLAEEVEWWDPGVIAEDWHMFLRSFIAKHGRVRTVGIFLPTSSDIVSATTAPKALKARYTQVVRHAWGAEDVGYLLVELPKSGVSLPRRAFIFCYVLHDHVLRAIVFVMLLSGTVIGWQVGSTHDIILLWNWWQVGLLLRILYAAASSLFIATIAMEVYRRRDVEGSTLELVAETVGSWALLPLVGLFSGWVPALHAQTKLMLAMPLHYTVAPKRIVSRSIEGPSPIEG